MLEMASVPLTWPSESLYGLTCMYWMLEMSTNSRRTADRVMTTTHVDRDMGMSLMPFTSRSFSSRIAIELRFFACSWPASHYFLNVQPFEHHSQRCTVCI